MSQKIFTEEIISKWVFKWFKDSMCKGDSRKNDNYA